MNIPRHLTWVPVFLILLFMVAAAGYIWRDYLFNLEPLLYSSLPKSKVLGVNSQDSSWPKYYSKAFGYTITYPPDWQVRDLKKEFADQKLSADSLEWVGFGLVNYDKILLSVRVTNQIVANEIMEFKKGLSPSLKIVSEQNMEFADSISTKIVYQDTLHPNKIETTTIFLHRGSQTYIISGQSKSEPDQKIYFNRQLNSFQFVAWELLPQIPDKPTPVKVKKK